MLDVSSSQRIKTARYSSIELNQLYHPTGTISQDSQNIVYSFETINSTKFIPILLKEWFFLIKEDGYLVIDYQPNEQLDFQTLEETMWWLWKGKYEIVYHGQVGQKDVRNLTEKKIKEFITNQENYYTSDLNKETHLPSPLVTQTNSISANGYLRFVCKKTASTLIPGDDITKWTFGIITNGKRKDWMEQIIQSIRAQKIPNYEIIICGTYYDRKEKDIKYIPFNQRDDKGWITKKKNIIVNIAKYENICIIHDRIVFAKNWYKGVRKWGNCFEQMTCKQQFNGERVGDWYMLEKQYAMYNKRKVHYVSYLDYRDWRKNVYIAGMLTIGKKTFFMDGWNETLYWNEAEDVELSFNLRDNGYLPRFNEHASVTSLAWRFKPSAAIVYDPVKDTNKHTGSKIIRIGRWVIYVLSKTFSSNLFIILGWKLFFESNFFFKKNKI